MKRKRDVESPRITYHASSRTFDRLFKEESLKEMKEVVRRKLGLGMDASISLAQLRDNRVIDLEDDDDFDAFQSVALSASIVNVRVTLGDAASSVENPGNGMLSDVSLQPVPESRAEQAGEHVRNPYEQVATQKRKVSFVPAATDTDEGGPFDMGDSSRRKKRKKLSHADAPANADPQVPEPGLGPMEGIKPTASLSRPVEALVISLEASNITSSPTKKKRKKKMVVGPSVEKGSEAAPTSVIEVAKAPPQTELSEAPVEPSSPGIEKKRKVKKRKSQAVVQPTESSLTEGRVVDLVDDQNQKVASQTLLEPLQLSKSKKSRKVSAAPPPLDSATNDRATEPQSVGFAAQLAEAYQTIHEKNRTASAVTAATKDKKAHKRKGRKSAPTEIELVPDVTTTTMSAAASSSTSESPVPHDIPTIEQVSVKSGEKRLSEKKHKPLVNDDEAEGEEDKAANKKPKRKARMSTSADVEAAQADVKAAMNKILAAHRASLNSQESLDGKVVPTFEVQQTQSPSSVLPKNPAPASTKEKRTTDPSACPLCLRSPLHARDQCPILQAGPDAIEKRLKELEQPVGQTKHELGIVKELHGILKKARANVKISKTTKSPPATQQIVRPSIRPAASDQSSTSSDEDAEQAPRPRPLQKPPSVLPAKSVASSHVVDDLVALMRGPVQSRRLSAADILSSDSSEDEKMSGVEDEEEMEEREPRKQARKARSPSSSDNESFTDDVQDSVKDDTPSVESATGDGEEPSDSNTSNASKLSGQPSMHDLDIEHPSFMAVDGMGESIEMEKLGDKAFSDALAAETAILDLDKNSPAVITMDLPGNDTALTLPAVDPLDLETEGLPLPANPPSINGTEASDETIVPVTDDITPADDGSDSQPTSQPANKVRAGSLPSTPRGALASRMRDRNGKPPSVTPIVLVPTRLQLRARATPPATGLSSQSSSQGPATRTRTRSAASQAAPPPSIPVSSQPRMIVTRGPEKGRGKVVTAPAVSHTKKGKGKDNAASQTTTKVNGKAVNGTQSSNGAESMSGMVEWEVLKDSSPQTSMMEDELHSGPELPSTIDEGDVLEKNPLFLPSESQAMFPYSQWNSIAHEAIHETVSANESEDEDEVEASVKSTAQIKPSTAPYRKLTDIASQHSGFFTPPTTLRPAKFPSTKEKLNDLYGNRAIVDDDDDDDVVSEEDSDSAENTSHFPQSRKAGVAKYK